MRRRALVVSGVGGAQMALLIWLSVMTAANVVLAVTLILQFRVFAVGA